MNDLLGTVPALVTVVRAVTLVALVLGEIAALALVVVWAVECGVMAVRGKR